MARQGAGAQFLGALVPALPKEIPGFVRLHHEYGGRGLQFVGVALDEAGKVRAYVDAEAIDYPILLGDASAAMLAQAAGNRLGGLPYTLVLDRQGKPVASLTGAVAEDRLEQLVKPLL